MDNQNEYRHESGSDRFGTWFAPAGRMEPGALIELAQHAVNNPVVQAVLQSMGTFVMVLNEQRQILAASDELYESLGIMDADTILGLRPGELLECENCEAGPDGCGTSQKCQACGAVIAILATQEHWRPYAEVCHLARHKEGIRENVDFLVQVTPLALEDHNLLVFVLQSISAA